MGDSVSETSCSWARDELVYEDELHHHHTHGHGDTPAPGGDDAVSAAVSLVVGSAREGVVALCTNVARILRDKKRLQLRVAELEEQVNTLENSSRSASVSVGGCSTTHSNTTDNHSLHDTSIHTRCGSAPPVFLASTLKLGRSEAQGNRDNQHSTRMVGARTSTVSMLETNSHFARNKMHNTPEKGEGFHRGHNHSSTRSLSIGGRFISGNFSRRRYSTISLRRVRRRSAGSREDGLSLWSLPNTTSTVTSGHNYQNSNKSCIITVAEVHTEPHTQTSANTESEAVRLLARTLTTVLQDQDGVPQETVSEPQATTTVSDGSSCSGELCAPHPLAGCQCLLCQSLSRDPSCHLYALSAEGGSLLPPGSRVLVQGDRVGTVLYLGHDRYPPHTKHSPQDPVIREDIICEDGREAEGRQDGNICPMSQSPILRPVGVTIRLWPPDVGQVFVPLSSVICQLDDEEGISHRCDQEFEYMDEDLEEGSINSHILNSYRRKESDDLSKSIDLPELIKSDESEFSPARVSTMLKCPGESVSRTASTEGYFIRSPSPSSYNSGSTMSLAALSLYGLEYQGAEDAFDEPGDIETSLQKGPLEGREYLSEGNVEPVCAREENDPNHSGLNTTFICRAPDGDDESKNKESSHHINFYDTVDSAICLNFVKKHKDTMNTDPSSLSDTDRDSPHLGDTWDSGCSVGRSRCKSDSSGHFSDIDSENSRRDSTRPRNLREALESMWSRQKNSRSNDNEGKYSRENKESSNKKKFIYENELDFMNSKISTIYIDQSTTGHSQV